MLDIRIVTFLCVCKHMNFTKAAEELHLTQPAVSQQMRSLESAYQAKLFRYENKKLRLTDAGALLRGAMEAIYHDTLKIRDAIQTQSKAQKLRIGATMTIGEFYLPDKLAEFVKNAKAIQLSVTVADTDELLAMLDGGTVDFALIEGFFRKEDYAFRLIQRDDIIAVCSSEYPIPDVAGIESLFSERLFLREPGSGTRAVFEHYLAENGYSLDSFADCSDYNSPHLIKRLLLSGLGISFLYRAVVRDRLETGALREIAIPHFALSHEYNAVWKKNSIFSGEYEHVMETLLS